MEKQLKDGGTNKAVNMRARTERERERETDRQTDRQTETERQRQTDRQTDRQKTEIKTRKGDLLLSVTTSTPSLVLLVTQSPFKYKNSGGAAQGRRNK